MAKPTDGEGGAAFDGPKEVMGAQEQEEKMELAACSASIPDDRKHYVLTDKLADYSKRLQLASAIADQIWREQGLVSSRIQWNLTFQAFLSGIYVFASSSLAGQQKDQIQYALAAIGFVVSACCLIGIRAAQEQSSRLKKHWVREFHPNPGIILSEKRPDPGQCNIQEGAFPQPFSATSGSRFGRFATWLICIAFMVMWLAMALIGRHINDGAKHSQFPAFVCHLSEANDKGTIEMSCDPK